MSTAGPVALSPLAGPPRKKWTRAQRDALAAAGLLDADQFELLEGELINRMGKRRPHINTFTRLQWWLLQTFGPLRVNVEAPIEVASDDRLWNEPCPDAVVLRHEDGASRLTHPGAAELDLVVEISASTLQYDLTIKAALYARAGILEYWVVDVRNGCVVVHTAPIDGRYQSTVTCHDSVAPLAAPESWLKITDLFPVLPED